MVKIFGVEIGSNSSKSFWSMVEDVNNFRKHLLNLIDKGEVEIQKTAEYLVKLNYDTNEKIDAVQAEANRRVDQLQAEKNRTVKEIQDNLKQISQALQTAKKILGGYPAEQQKETSN